MKLWKNFINQVWQVEDPISTRDAVRVLLAVVMLCTMVGIALANFQLTSNVF